MSIFLMGVYDPHTDKWCTVTKCGSGFDDKTLDKLQKDFNMVKISKVYINPNVGKTVQYITSALSGTFQCSRTI